MASYLLLSSGLHHFNPAPEVIIRGVQFEPVLDRQRREVSVRNQITVPAWRREKSRQNFGVALRRPWNPRRAAYGPPA